MKRIIFAIIGLAVVIISARKIKSMVTKKCPHCNGTGISHTEYYPEEDIDVEHPCHCSLEK